MRALTSRPLRSSRSSSLVKGASSEYRWEDAHWRKHGRAPGSSPTFGRITEEREDTIFEWEVDAPINYLCTLRASNDALAHPRLCPHTRRTSFYQRLAAMQICEWTFRVLGLARLPARHVLTHVVNESWSWSWGECLPKDGPRRALRCRVAQEGPWSRGGRRCTQGRRSGFSESSSGARLLIG